MRETLFNWIEHLTPDIGAVRGLDMFTGTGALGFELASRGAGHVTLIEASRHLVDQLIEIKRKLGADRVEIIAADARAIAARWPAASFELIFVDPPFDSGLIGPALAAASRLLAPRGMIYAESGSGIDDLLAGYALQVVRQGRAGRVHFYLLRHA